MSLDPRSLLVEKRFELYLETAGLIQDLEELARRPDVRRLQEGFERLRETIRGYAAVVTEEVYRELERLEAWMLVDEPSGEDLIAFRETLPFLHASLADMLRRTDFDAIEDILDFSPEFRNKRKKRASLAERRAEDRRLAAGVLELQLAAARAISARDFKKGIRLLQRAIKLAPDRAVLHNDLGLALARSGRFDDAIARYQKAIRLNTARPEYRTEEWTTTFYNMAVARRRAALACDQKGNTDGAVVHLEAARAAFSEYLASNPTGRKRESAQQQLQEVERDLTILTRPASVEGALEEEQAGTEEEVAVEEEASDSREAEALQDEEHQEEEAGEPVDPAPELADSDPPAIAPSRPEATEPRRPPLSEMGPPEEDQVEESEEAQRLELE